MEEYYLLQDVIGAFSCIDYAKKGDKVLMLSEHDIMAIVQKGKIRFPVKLEWLSKEVVKKDLTDISVGDIKIKKGRKATKKTKSLF